jgi:hypothetical protein
MLWHNSGPYLPINGIQINVFLSFYLFIYIYIYINQTLQPKNPGGPSLLLGVWKSFYSYLKVFLFGKIIKLIFFNVFSVIMLKI